MEQYRLNFRANNGSSSSCDLTIYRDIQLIVVSKTGEGSSVTNSAETIATKCVAQFGLDPGRMLFVEHYPESQRPQPWGESYDLVTFTWDSNQARNPDWQRLTVDEFNDILNLVTD